MKSYKTLKATLLAAHIEYHWSRILHFRKQANKLLEHGTSLSSNRMLRLNQRLMRHGLAAMRKQSYYETHFVSPLRA